MDPNELTIVYSDGLGVTHVEQARCASDYLLRVEELEASGYRVHS